MKIIYVSIFVLIAFISRPGHAIEPGQAGKEWEKLNKELIDKGKARPFAINAVRDGSEICYDKSGKDIGEKSCDLIESFIKLISSSNPTWGCDDDYSKEECIKVHEDALIALEQKLEKVNSADGIIKENLDQYLKVAPNQIKKSLADVKLSLAGMKDPKGAKNRALTKIRSKECKIARLELGICQKSYVKAATDSAMDLEKEATKQSGVVNQYGRYKIGQMKAMHGTGQLGSLKAQYQKLKGSAWNPKSCEGNAEEVQCNSGSGGPRTTPCSVYSNEFLACGCVQEIGSDNDCPRGENGTGHYLE